MFSMKINQTHSLTLAEMAARDLVMAQKATSDFLIATVKTVVQQTEQNLSMETIKVSIEAMVTSIDEMLVGSLSEADKADLNKYLVTMSAGSKPNMEFRCFREAIGCAFWQPKKLEKIIKKHLGLV